MPVSPHCEKTQYWTPTPPFLPLFSQRCMSGPGGRDVLPSVTMVPPSAQQGPGLSDSEGPVEWTWSSTPILHMGTLRLRDMNSEVLDVVAQQWECWGWE